MASRERSVDRGTRLGDKVLRALAEEFRNARLGFGLSQQAVANAAALARSRYSDIERNRTASLGVLEACRIGSALGLDISVRAYPGGMPVRDKGHRERLDRLLQRARRPLTCRREVPLPALPDRTEQRAWDAVLFGRGERTAIELEMRLRDGQAVERRLALKRRDDPTEHFLLGIADTRTNRRVLAERLDLLGDLPRLRRAETLAALEAGMHPPTGLVLI